MKPVDDAIPKIKVHRPRAMDPRRAKRLFVSASREETDTFGVEVRQTGWQSSGTEALPATSPVEPPSVPSANGK